MVDLCRREKGFSRVISFSNIARVNFYDYDFVEICNYNETNYIIVGNNFEELLREERRREKTAFHWKQKYTRSWAAPCFARLYYIEYAMLEKLLILEILRWNFNYAELSTLRVRRITTRSAYFLRFQLAFFSFDLNDRNYLSSGRRDFRWEISNLLHLIAPLILVSACSTFANIPFVE